MKVLISLVAVSVVVALGVSLTLNLSNQPSAHFLPSLQPLDESKPVDAFDGIIKAFDKFPIVALGEAHHLQEESDFIAQLIRRPDFSAKVNAIVVECGNALYQDVIDRYVAGQEVPRTELQKVWRNTISFFVWDSPIYERLFANVRAVNQSLPAARRLRVLLGDPPIDWSKVQTKEDFTPFMYRDYVPKVIEQEVLTKNRKALIIYGGGHLVRHKITTFHNLEQKYPQSFFIIMPYFGFLERNDELEPRIAKWPKPSLALVKGTWLGAQADSLIMAVTIRSRGRAPYNPYAETTIEELADAFLYLGPSDSLTTSGPSPEIYQDEAYLKELKRRHILVRGREMDPGATTFTLPRKYRDFLKLRGQ